MLKTAIPFELHLTIGYLDESRLDSFVRFCESVKAKPLLIELSRGDSVQQPMLSKIITATTLDEALAVANDLSDTLQQHHFAVKRLKVEVPAKQCQAFAGLTTAFSKYFEWHGKVLYNEPDQLLQLCETHQVHLSKNALKNEQKTRFITLREYGNHQQFQKRVDAITTDLIRHGRQLLKQEAEYCIYDNNTYLDRGWLPE